MDTKSRLYFCGDDLIHRGVYAQNIKSIIRDCHTFPKSNDNKSYVIGLDAPWGSGKTCFMQMLSSYLEGEWEKPGLEGEEKNDAKNGTGAVLLPGDTDTFTVVYYDAWENDFWDDAFVPLFDSFIQAAPIKYEAEEKDLFEMGKSAARIIAYVAKGLFSKKVESFIDPDAIDEINKEVGTWWKNASSHDYQTGETFPDYKLYKDAINSLRSYLSAIAKRENKLVIIIDELDRCKPTFAVQTLEIVKHLFNVEGLVFLFALDINQLSHSIKVVYGNDFDAIGYLERFFNYLTILPHGKVSSVKQSVLLIKNMGLQRVYDGFDDNLLYTLIQITEMYNLSLREVKTVISAFSVLMDTVLAQYYEYPNAIILYFYFLCMKYKYPVLLSDGVFKKGSEEIGKFVTHNRIPFRLADQSEYDDVIRVIGWNHKIGESSHVIFQDNRVVVINYTPYNMEKIITIKSNEIILKNWGSINANEHTSVSMLLYFPDLNRYEEIKDYTVLEFVFRQLEMCDFIREE